MKKIVFFLFVSITALWADDYWYVVYPQESLPVSRYRINFQWMVFAASQTDTLNMKIWDKDGTRILEKTVVPDSSNNLYIYYHYLFETDSLLKKGERFSWTISTEGFNGDTAFFVTEASMSPTYPMDKEEDVDYAFGHLMWLVKDSLVNSCELMLGEDSSAMDVIFIDEVDSKYGNYVYFKYDFSKLTLLEGNTTYYWKVNTPYEEGPVWSFKTKPESDSTKNSPPGKPTIYTPKNNATVYGLYDDEADSFCQFISIMARDPDYDSLFYHVFLDTVYPPVKEYDSSNISSFSPQDILFHQRYYLYAIADDGEDRGPSSDTITFETANYMTRFYELPDTFYLDKSKGVIEFAKMLKNVDHDTLSYYFDTKMNITTEHLDDGFYEITLQDSLQPGLIAGRVNDGRSDAYFSFNFKYDAEGDRKAPEILTGPELETMFYSGPQLIFHLSADEPARLVFFIKDENSIVDSVSYLPSKYHTRRYEKLEIGKYYQIKFALTDFYENRYETEWKDYAVVWEQEDIDFYGKLCYSIINESRTNIIWVLDNNAQSYQARVVYGVNGVYDQNVEWMNFTGSSGNMILDSLSPYQYYQAYTELINPNDGEVRVSDTVRWSHYYLNDSIPPFLTGNPTVVTGMNKAYLHFSTFKPSTSEVRVVSYSEELDFSESISKKEHYVLLSPLNSGTKYQYYITTRSGENRFDWPEQGQYLKKAFGSASNEFTTETESDTLKPSWLFRPEIIKSDGENFLARFVVSEPVYYSIILDDGTGPVNTFSNHFPESEFTLALRNLEPGREYRLKAQLTDFSNNQNNDAPPFIVNGGYYSFNDNWSDMETPRYTRIDSRINLISFQTDDYLMSANTIFDTTGKVISSLDNDQYSKEHYFLFYLKEEEQYHHFNLSHYSGESMKTQYFVNKDSISSDSEGLVVSRGPSVVYKNDRMAVIEASFNRPVSFWADLRDGETFRSFSEKKDQRIFLNGLKANEEFEARVFAMDFSGEQYSSPFISFQCDSLPDTTGPSPQRDIVLSETDDGRLRVSWKNPEENDFHCSEVFKSNGEEFYSLFSSYLDTVFYDSLSRGVSYYLKAYDYSGNVSFSSDTAVFGETPVDEKDKLENKLKIFPNPVSSNLFIEYSGNDEWDLEVFDILGRTVFSKDGIKGDYSWDCRSAKGKTVGAGIYLIGIKGKDFKMIRKTVVIH